MAPQLFRRTIVTCDLVNDSAEQVLELTSCFAGGAGGVPELGLGGAETNCVCGVEALPLAVHQRAALPQVEHGGAVLHLRARDAHDDHVGRLLVLRRCDTSIRSQRRY